MIELRKVLLDREILVQEICRCLNLLLHHRQLRFLLEPTAIQLRGSRQLLPLIGINLEVHVVAPRLRLTQTELLDRWEIRGVRIFVSSDYLLGRDL